MYRRVMAIFLQYDVRLILLVELPARNLLYTCIMRTFIAFTEMLGLSSVNCIRNVLKMFNVLEINLLVELQFHIQKIQIL